eukprot:m.127037 g.127037  ORF g.127037 m.127037 type:complete len:106 (+) comp16353_c1_seq2:299-616(+)
MSQPPKPEVDDSPYISEFANQHIETTGEKFVRKFKQNPFVPIGLGLTGVALVGGLIAFKSGHQRWSQNFQRMRVGFQGLTVAAMVGGALVMETLTSDKADDGKKK